MITVEVSVPSLAREYQFNLDENTAVEKLTAEMAGVIAQKEQAKLSGDADRLILCSGEKRMILAKSSTLAELGIRSADRLILA